VLLSVAVAPSVFLLLFVYLRDKYEHEPLGLIGMTFVLGALGMLPAMLIELLLGWLFPSNLIVTVFLYVAVVEETIKFGAVRIKAYLSPHFNETMDGIVYAVAAGLGFATVENILYVVQHGLSAAIVRAFLSVPGHAVWAGIMGFYLGLAKCKTMSKSQEGRQIVKGVGIAILLHGLYDSLVFSQNLLGVIAVSIIGWIIFLELIRKALSLSPFRWRGTSVTYPQEEGASVLPPSRFCTQCGFRLAGNEKFCMNCGFPISRQFESNSGL
jgi:RsiW-degrading membrane proteinase PrsW (M82 family)